MKITGADRAVLWGLFITCVLGPMSCGIGSAIERTPARECAKACGDAGVQRVSDAECRCR